jgi:hypothetical protein
MSSRPIETCVICGCQLHRTKNSYASPTAKGRSHASEHHYVPERFFGRSKNRKGTHRKKIFKKCPWGHESEHGTFCYDCHEELLHNPILLPEDISRLANIIRERGLEEHKKTASRNKIAGRIILFHEIIQRGLEIVVKESRQKVAPQGEGRGQPLIKRAVAAGLHKNKEQL